MGVGRRPARAHRAAARARRTSGRPARPGRAARARSSTSTAAWSGASPTTCPAARTSASWSTGTSSSCSTTRTRSTTLTPLPSQNIDTGLGLNRMALIQQGVADDLRDRPVRAAHGARARARDARDARRARAAHPRRPLARDDVPDRRRRRALQRGPRLHPAPRHAPRDPAGPPDRHRGAASCRAFVEQVIETMGAGYPELDQPPRHDPQVGARRGGGLRPHARAGHAAARRPARRRRAVAGRRLPPARHVRLPDRADARDRRRARRAVRGRRGVRAPDGRAARPVGGRGRSLGGRPAAPTSCARSRPSRPTFTGYEQLEQHTTVAGVLERDGRTFVKLAESPFYAEGGGQVSDAGTIACADGRLPRARRRRSCAPATTRRSSSRREAGRLEPGERVVARVDPIARHATEANHTATHLLHAALREVLGDHVHQAGSYVGPDKLRFDFTHTQRLSRGRAPSGRGPRQRVDPAQRPGAPDHHDARRGPAPRGDGALRREVRRRRAHGRDRRRLVLARAVRRHARALDRRDRPVRADLRGLERVQRAAHRGADRARGRAPRALPRPRAARGGGPAARAHRGGAGRHRARCSRRRARPRRPARPTARSTCPRSSSRAGQVDGAIVLAEVVEAPDAKALLDLADRVKGKLGEQRGRRAGLRGGRPRAPRGERRAGARRSAA